MLLSSTPTRRYRLDRPRRESTRGSLTPAPGEAPKRLWELQLPGSQPYPSPASLLHRERFSWRVDLVTSGRLLRRGSIQEPGRCTCLGDRADLVQQARADRNPVPHTRRRIVPLRIARHHDRLVRIHGRRRPQVGPEPRRGGARTPRRRQRRQPPLLRRRSCPSSAATARVLPAPPTTSIVTVRGWSDRGPAASLRAGRNFASRPKIASPIDDKIKQTKELETNRITRPAGRRLAVLREAAGRTLTGIPHT